MTKIKTLFHFIDSLITIFLKCLCIRYLRAQNYTHKESRSDSFGTGTDENTCLLLF